MLANDAFSVYKGWKFIKLLAVLFRVDIPILFLEDHSEQVPLYPAILRAEPSLELIFIYRLRLLVHQVGNEVLFFSQ